MMAKRVTRQTKRLPADDPRVAPLMTDKQKRKSAGKSVAVEVAQLGPSPTLTPVRVAPTSNDLDEPIRQFKLSIDEDEFVGALELQPAESKWGRLYRLFALPGMHFMKAIKQEGISLLELNTFWLENRQQVGMVEAMNELPAVMRETAKLAREKSLTCAKCEGKGYIYKEEKEVVQDDDGKLQYGEPELVKKPCPACVDSDEKGRVIQPGDVKSKEFLFEIAGLTSRGVNVNVNHQSLTFNGVEHEVSNIGKILEGRPARVEIPAQTEMPPIDVEDLSGLEKTD